MFGISVSMTEQLAFKTTKRREQKRKDDFRMAQAHKQACWLTLWMSWMAEEASMVLWRPSCCHWLLKRWEEKTHLNKSVAKTLRMLNVFPEITQYFSYPFLNKDMTRDYSGPHPRNKARMTNDKTWGRLDPGRPPAVQCSPHSTAQLHPQQPANTVSLASDSRRLSFSLFHVGLNPKHQLLNLNGKLRC